MGDDEPLRLGIAGTGFIGAVHAQNAQASRSVELVAVASARGTIGDRMPWLAPGVRTTGLDELFAADDVEAVLVATRTSDHPEHAAAVLAAGKHLLLEKPGATSTAGHAAIVRAVAARPDLVVRVAYHRRHDPEFAGLVRRVHAGDIGEPFAVHLMSREDFPPTDFDRHSGGFVLDVGVHDFDTAHWVLGSVSGRVLAAAHAPVYPDAGPDNVYVLVEAGAAVATVHLSRTCRAGMDIRCEVIGSDGALHIGGPAASYPGDCRDRFAAAYVAELHDFAAACRGRAAPGATLADDGRAIAVALAAGESLATGAAADAGLYRL
jgi:myo-inositol 2-dehydrogenase / D-chiro-inositol 1-dehydrogenase